MKFCTKCGQELEDNAVFCSACGAKCGGENTSAFSDDIRNFTSGDADASSKSRIVCAVLAWFLGGIGAHCYYVGKIKQGVLMTIFCWTLIPSIIAFVQFIIILCGSWKDSEDKIIKNW